MSKQVVQFIDTRKYHKSNYDDIFKFNIPSMYFEEDYALKNKDIDILDKVINSHLKIIENFSELININPTYNSIYSSINTPQGISKFFIKQNKLTDISLNDFERKILLPLDKSFNNFKTSAEFSDYLSQDLLPKIRLNEPILDFVGDSSLSSNHNYLITNLSWLYFLNFTTVSGYNPHNYVLNVLVSKLYNSDTITLNDGIKGLTEYIWKNYEYNPSWHSFGILPNDFRPPQYTTNNSYTNGTQQLEKLKTLVDVIYSPLYLDNGDYRVRDAINDFLENSYLITSKKLQGPFLNLLKAFSFGFADYSNQIDTLEVLNNLDLCPDRYLPLLADLIGWKLFGAEPDRWRLQLSNAVNIYKVVGTKKSIQFVIDSIFGEDVFSVSSSIKEAWESYVPFLIYYALATESNLFEDFYTWNDTIAHDLGISSVITSSMDDNIRLCVDKIIYDLVTTFPSNFMLGGKPFNLTSEDFIFNYRNRDFKVPPFEEISYYLHVLMSNDMVDMIEDKLVCFGVPLSFAQKVTDYIRRRSISTDDDFNIKNSWLLFTSGVEYPPNWDSVIRDISNKKSEYLSLWNGKSSHFKIFLDVSGFDFAKNSLDADSKEALMILGQAVKEFSPAKSIPNLIARSSIEDNYSFNSNNVQFAKLDKLDHPQLKFASGSILAGFGTSALPMSSYKRGLTSSSTATFARLGVDSVVDPLIYSGTPVNLPRRGHRRRNYKFTLPRDGYYDRTGFNMPIPLQTYLRNNEEVTYYPLGLIPSSQSFVPIYDYNNIPAIYNKCENLNSSSIYSGIAVSNTFPVRGWTPL